MVYNLDMASTREDVWPLPRDVKAFLASRSNGPDSASPEEVMWNNPRILADMLGVNKMALLLGGLYSPPTINQMSSEETVTEKMQRFAKEGAWRQMFDFTVIYLTKCGQGIQSAAPPPSAVIHTPESLQIWLCRMIAMVKLGMVKEAIAELDTFGSLDRADIYYEFYPELYPGKTGCMFPFSLRLLHAEMPSKLEKPQFSLDRLHPLLQTCENVLSNLSQGFNELGETSSLTSEEVEAANTLWKSRHSRVLFSITNCLVLLSDYDSALQVLENKLDQTKDVEILSGMGRLAIKLGDVNAASRIFAQVQNLTTKENNPVRLAISIMNEGFLGVAKGQYEVAAVNFLAAYSADPTLKVAANNHAVCLLYSGRHQEAVEYLESLAGVDSPTSQTSVHENMLFNLCTLYEFAYSKPIDVAKKRAILPLVAQFGKDDFETGSLKL